MTREEKDRLKDIDARLKAIQEENERVLNALVRKNTTYAQIFSLVQIVWFKNKYQSDISIIHN